MATILIHKLVSKWYFIFVIAALAIEDDDCSTSSNLRRMRGLGWEDEIEFKTSTCFKLELAAAALQLVVFVGASFSAMMRKNTAKQGSYQNLDEGHVQGFYTQQQYNPVPGYAPPPNSNNAYAYQQPHAYQGSPYVAPPQPNQNMGYPMGYRNIQLSPQYAPPISSQYSMNAPGQSPNDSPPASGNA